VRSRLLHAAVSPLMVGTLGLAAVSCGTASASGTAGRQLADIDTSVVPSTLNGLPVTHEDIRSTLVKAANTYLSAAALFSVRRQNVVQATLQISRFNSVAKPASLKFREAVLNLLSSGSPAPVTLGTDTVYLTTGNKQRVFVWFKGVYLLVLSVRDDYEQPRTLLRDALAVNLP
jgi:hypothetical protein